MTASSAPPLEIATATDPGRVRPQNEDTIAVAADIGLAVLADGMGGYNAGEVASDIAVKTTIAEMKRALEARAHVAADDQLAAALLKECSAKANAAIYQAARSEPRYAGMGTTLVAAFFHGDSVTVGHAGDSRLYRLRGDRFERITRDHSLVQELIDRDVITPEDARYSRYRNLVTCALGLEPEVDAEVHTYPIKPGDLYLLCSDGLTDMIRDDDIQRTLAALQSNLALAARRLVQIANDAGGRDNVSVVLVRVRDDCAEPRRRSRRRVRSSRSAG